MPTQIRQIIGISCFAWGIAVLAGQGMAWLNVAINAQMFNLLFVMVIALLASGSGIFGGWKLLKKQDIGFYFCIPFCIYHLLSGAARYMYTGGENAGAQSQLALFSTILASVLLILSLLSVFSGYFRARTITR